MQIFLLAFFLSFSSCAPKGPPCWLTGPCIPYEVEEWIIGVGSGSSQSDADKIAIVDRNLDNLGCSAHV